MNLQTPLNDLTYVAFDTETSGAYPVGFDVVEFGAIKWFQGKEIGRIQFLCRPRETMSDFIIGIHGITNEMVSGTQPFSDHIHEVAEFFKGSIILAHHAPFDMGFLALAFEKAHIPLPSEPGLCTSLLSRKWIHGVENHKLQTLVQHLQVPGGQAHRAFDDAYSCLQVALACFQKMPVGTTLENAIQSQGKNLLWKDFALGHLTSSKWRALFSAIENKHDIDLLYRGGGQKGETRRITPLGVVRNPDGDYMQGLCHREKTSKRYYLSRIEDMTEVF